MIKAGGGFFIQRYGNKPLYDHIITVKGNIIKNKRKVKTVMSRAHVKPEALCNIQVKCVNGSRLHIIPGL